MIFLVHTSFRGVLISMLILFFLSLYITVQNSKGKDEYQKTSGTIEFYGKEYQHLPTRHKGDFRYLVVDSYPYPFEIYEPNSLATEMTIDDLRLGDLIDVYYFERRNTREIGLNRFVQFIDSDGHPYFVRNSFQKYLGYLLQGLCCFVVLGAWLLFKYKKLPW